MEESFKYSELYAEYLDVIKSWADINALCTHTFHQYRFNPTSIKRLHKRLETLTTTKDLMQKDLDDIQQCFDNLETRSIIYLFSFKRVQDELLALAQPDENTSGNNEMQKEAEKEEKEVEKGIIKTNDAEFREELARIEEYIDKF